MIAGIKTTALVGIVALLAACSDSNVIGPDNQPEIANDPDTFEFQITGLDDVSQTLQYTWQNTGVRANVNRSSSISAGEATLIVRDGSGAEVFHTTLNQNSTVTTAEGVAGSWTIEVVLLNVFGTINFRLEKTT